MFKSQQNENFFLFYCSLERHPIFLAHRLLPIRVSVTPKSLHIEQGGTARFICNHDSDLTSTITWRRENFEKLPSDAQVKNGIITIPNVNQGHSGLYSCKVSNQYSNDQVSVQLRVGGKIFFDSLCRLSFSLQLIKLSLRIFFYKAIQSFFFFFFYSS